MPLTRPWRGPPTKNSIANYLIIEGEDWIMSGMNVPWCLSLSRNPNAIVQSWTPDTGAATTKNVEVLILP